MNNSNLWIIILNWNGWEDTLECLESIWNSNYPYFRCIVIDNGSSDNSCERILKWAYKSQNTTTDPLLSGDKYPEKILVYDKKAAENGGNEKEERKLHSPGRYLVLIKNHENSGFAGGCNIGLRYALSKEAELVFFLNNDTIIDKDALGRMAGFLKERTDYCGVTGQIRLYHDPERTWNCGGNLRWYGARKYIYSDTPVVQTPQNGYRRITFVTGCAVMFRIDIFRDTGLLTEKFFFGEEDFELSLRLYRQRFKIAILFTSIIYHKVNVSINKSFQDDSLSKIYSYYLKRFINLRDYWPFWRWRLWRFFYGFYIVWLLKTRYRIQFKSIFSFLRSLYRDSSQLNEVNKKTFQHNPWKNYPNSNIDV